VILSPTGLKLVPVPDTAALLVHGASLRWPTSTWTA